MGFPKAFWVAGETIVGKPYDKAAVACRVAAVQQRGSVCHEYTPLGLPLAAMVDEEELGCARSFFAAFRRADHAHCAWHVGLYPMMRLVLDMNGYHPVNLADFRRARDALTSVVHGSWFVNSRDGIAPPTAPCPLAGVASAGKTRRMHVDPVFVDRDAPPRGSLIGTNPCHWKQLIALLLGAAHVERAQCYRLASHMYRRASSAADVTSSAGRSRSLKGTNCDLTDRNVRAMGTLPDRVIASKIVRVAWERNLLE